MAKKFLDSTGLKQVWAAVTDKVDTAVVDMNKTTEEITLEGTELADQLKDAGYTDGVIPAGTSVQDILTKLFCKEIYPNTSANTPSYSVSIDAPTITTTNSINNGDLVEVGATVEFGSVVTPEAKTSKIDPKVSGLTHGYWVYDSENDSWSINKNTSLTTGWTIEQKDDSKYKLTPSIVSGFAGDLPTVVEGVDSIISLGGCNLKAALGVNSYKVTVTSPTYTGSHDGIASVFEVSNLGNKSDSEKTPAITAASGVEHDKTSATTFTVTGVYPVYSNRTGDDSLNSAEVSKMDLSTGSAFEITYGKETVNDTDKYINMFAYPAIYTSCEVYVYNPMSKEFDLYEDGSITDVIYNIQGAEVGYKLWKRTPGTVSPYTVSTKFKFVLNKGLDA